MRKELLRKNPKYLKELGKRLGQHNKVKVSKEQMVNQILEKYPEEKISLVRREMLKDSYTIDNLMSKKELRVSIISLVTTIVLGVFTLILSKSEGAVQKSVEQDYAKDTTILIDPKGNFKIVLNKPCDTCISKETNFIVVTSNDAYKLTPVDEVTEQLKKGKVLLKRDYIEPWANGTQEFFHGNYAKAIYYFELMHLDTTAVFEDVFLKLGVSNFFLKKYRLAADDLEKVIQINSNNAFAYGGLGLLYHFFLSDSAKAIKHYIQAIALKSDYEAARNNLGILYSQLGKYNLAQQVYNEALIYYPDSYLLYYNIAANYARQRKTKEVLANIKRSCDLGLPMSRKALVDPVFKLYSQMQEFIEIIKSSKTKIDN